MVIVSKVMTILLIYYNFFFAFFLCFSICDIKIHSNAEKDYFDSGRHAKHLFTIQNTQHIIITHFALVTKLNLQIWAFFDIQKTHGVHV